MGFYIAFNSSGHITTRYRCKTRNRAEIPFSPRIAPRGLSVFQLQKDHRYPSTTLLIYIAIRPTRLWSSGYDVTNKPRVISKSHEISCFLLFLFLFLFFLVFLWFSCVFLLHLRSAWMCWGGWGLTRRPIVAQIRLSHKSITPLIPIPHGLLEKTSESKYYFYDVLRELPVNAFPRPYDCQSVRE